MLKRLKNKSGYTLTYAIIIIGLLMILTASIITITYFNFKLARTGGEVNTSFYANDGAIEEALTELSRYSYNAEVLAWEAINNGDYAAQLLWDSFILSVKNDINDDILTIDEANNIISSAIRGYFEVSFYNYLLEGSPVSHSYYSSGAIGSAKYPDYLSYQGVTFSGVVNLDSVISIKLLTTTFNPSSIVSPTVEDSSPNPADITTITLSDPVADGFLALTIKSDGTYHKRKKKLSVNVDIIPPSYNFSVATPTQSISLQKNDITDSTLVAKGNLVFGEGTTNVVGDINAYGNNIDFKYDQPRNSYGGILIGETGTVTVDVTGNVSSRNSVKMMSNNSSLTVSENIFANSLYVHSSADDIVLNVKDSIYLYSDLYIAGNRADITIADSNTDASGTDNRSDIDTYIPSEGNLFGLLSLHPVALDTYTRTGSIIVSETVEAPSITLNGLFLNGVIRYDVVDQNAFKSGREEAYKTGESFTTYKNKEYYQTLTTSSIYRSGVISSLENFIINTSIDADEPTNLAQLVSFNTALDLTLDETRFRAIHFFTTGFYAWQERQAGNTAPFTNDDIDSVDKSIIKLRNPKLEGDSFYGVNALGLVQFKDASVSGDSGKVYHPDRVNLTAINNNRVSTFAEIDEHANLLGYANYQDLPRYNASDMLKTRVDILDEDGDTDTSEVMEGWLDYGASNTVENLNPLAIAIFNKDETKDIYINFSSNNVGHLNILEQNGGANEVFEGTIVSEGNIYINSNQNMTFRGNIISNKNIYLVGTGTKNIIHDEFVIYSNIEKWDELKKLYYTNNGRQLLSSGAMFNNDLYLTLGANTTTIDVNYADDAIIGGTTVIDSKSLHINSWTEED